MILFAMPIWNYVDQRAVLWLHDKYFYMYRGAGGQGLLITLESPKPSNSAVRLVSSGLMRHLGANVGVLCVGRRP